MLDLILATHLASTWLMVGVIWYVQLVHYPHLRFVSDSEWKAAHRQHMQRTTLIVAAPMLIEATCALALLWFPESRDWRAVTGVVLVAVIWLSTSLIQVRQHNQLERRMDTPLILQLCRYNWIRTLAWTARGFLAVSLMIR